QVSSSGSAIAAVAEKCGNVAGRAPSCVLDPPLSHTGGPQRRFNAKAQIEVGLRDPLRVVGGGRTVLIAKRRREVGAHFVAASLDARPDRRDEARGIGACEELNGAHPARGDGGTRTAPAGVDGGRLTD